MLLKDWLVKDLLTSKLKFLADEDVDARLVKSLSNKGIDIVYSPKGIRNSDLYSLACKEERALLTRDKDFLNTALFPPSMCPAIVVLRMHPPDVSRTEHSLLKLIEQFSDNMKGKTLALKEEGIDIAD